MFYGKEFQLLKQDQASAILLYRFGVFLEGMIDPGVFPIKSKCG